MLRVGAIGYGYWGPNVVRNFQDLPGATVVAVCELDERRRAAAQSRHPHLRATADAAELIAAADVDLVVVTTPVGTHFDLARAALMAGKHVLVAKPLARTVPEAEELVALAAESRRLLAVDHTFVYTSAIRRMRDLVVAGDIGEPYYYDSTRVNLGLVQSDVNVLWDLATHDLAILDFLFGREPVGVAARAVAHVGARETVAYLFLRFSGSLVAHVNVNWLAPRKVRTIFVGGSRRMIVYDDNDPSEKVKVYDKGVLLEGAVDRARALVQYRTGDMFAPQVENVEALRVECQHLLDCVERGETPVTGGAHALRVVRWLAAAERSLAEGGREVRP